jgi:adenine/guanine phosphoribosyltransferase-like PRPP-binding protein
MKYSPCYSHMSYLEKSIRTANLRITIRELAAALKGHQFDAIAFRGMSGALVAPSLALRLNKTLLMVRKDKETHSYYQVEGDWAARRYVIVDDLIDSGETVATIFEQIRGFASEAICIGIVRYCKIEHGLRSLHDFEDVMKRIDEEDHKFIAE